MAKLDTVAWQTIHLPEGDRGSCLLVKSAFRDRQYKILATDKTSMWIEEMSSDHIMKQFKKLNPMVDMPVYNILEHIQKNLENSSQTKMSTVLEDLAESEEQKLVLTMHSKLTGQLEFLWRFHCLPVEKHEMANHMTVPLLMMVSELDRQKGELFKLLKNKDKEIADLQAQGVRTSRKHLETPVFEETSFYNNMVTSKGFEDNVRSDGNAAFDKGKDCKDLYGELMRKKASLVEGEAGEGNARAATDKTTGESWANRMPPSIAGSSSSIRSPNKSPAKSPAKSPVKEASSTETSPAKDTELLRRQALERRLAEEEEKKNQKKKKKKIKF